MNQYRKSLLIRRNLQIVLMIIIPAVILLTHLCFEDSSVWRGTSIGFICGTEIVSIIRLFRINRLLKNKEQMKDAYISEIDERNRAVIRKSAGICLWVFVVLLAYGAMIASFINMIVFYTLAITLLVLLIMYLAVYLYLKYRV